MAEGAGCGAVKPATVTEGGRVGAREARQDRVIEAVELGFMRRMEMGWVVVPVMVGRAKEVMVSDNVPMHGQRVGDLYL